MRKFSAYILLVAMLVCMFSCKRGPRVIPRGDMTKIYAEMFLLDETISDSRELRRMADTSRVYEAVLEKYGYTVEDYLASQEKYILDAGRYVKMLKKAVRSLEAENKVLEKEKERIDAIAQAQENIRRFAPEKVYYMTGLHNPNRFGNDTLKFCVDTSGGEWTFEPAFGLDTLQVVDTLACLDSLK